MLYNLILTSVRVYLMHLLSCFCPCFHAYVPHAVCDCIFCAGQGCRVPPHLGVLAAGRPTGTPQIFPQHIDPAAGEPLQPEKSPHSHTGQYSSKTGPSLHLGQFGGASQVQNPGGTTWALCWSELCWTLPLARCVFICPVDGCSWSRWAGPPIYFMEDFVKWGVLILL